MFLLSSHQFFDDGVTGINVYIERYCCHKEYNDTPKRGHKNHFLTMKEEKI
jgi:hypothetical protein